MIIYYIFAKHDLYILLLPLNNNNNNHNHNHNHNAFRFNETAGEIPA